VHLIIIIYLQVIELNQTYFDMCTPIAVTFIANIATLDCQLRRHQLYNIKLFLLKLSAYKNQVIKY